MGSPDKKLPAPPAENEDVGEPPSYAQANLPNTPRRPAAVASSSAAPAFRTQFACLTLNQHDLLRCINFPANDVHIIRQVLQTIWPRGLQAEGPYGPAREFKLNGYPWAYSAHGDDDARYLMLRLFETLYNRGWVISAAVDMSKKEADKDSLIFRHQAPVPPECHWLSISFDSWSKLKVIGAPSAELAQALVQTFGGAVSESELANGRLKIKFHGTPWLASGVETVTSRLMLLGMLQTLEAFGYTVYTSIDMINGREGSETDVLIVHKQRDWQPGMPIWHR
ncbi:hypothetical protein GQ53DRAFT_835005 [Thozetella sp. PMI_491]|nr:hypothetical protein GQ53DRAFT_835005 [Thozetella sp. PMI_491]